MKVLALACHPDDETLGCGGTLLKHKAIGDELYWVIVTRTHSPQWPTQVIDQKSREVESVAQAYGMKGVFRLDYPALKLDMIPMTDLIASIRQAVSKIRPDEIYLVNGTDVHSDHQAVFNAAMSAIKPLDMNRLGVKRMLSYETLSSTEAAPPARRPAFQPNIFVDISAHMKAKLGIMKLYETEIQPDPLPRGPAAITALGRFRGATFGVEYAEAFALIREVA
jgi:LmbE family N-acetylglucosaminyl deacetylase